MEQMKLDMEKKESEETFMKQELAAIKHREVLKAKKKKGLKKFFSRTVAANGAANARPNTSEGYDMTSPSPKVGTIAPPSMADANYSIVLDDSSDDDESESLMSDSLFSTSVSVIGADDAPQVETVMSEDSSVGKRSKKSKPLLPSSTSPSKKETPTDSRPPVPPKLTLTEKMRKVQSMGPRIASPSKSSSAPMKRSVSKLIEEADGAVELETIDTDETGEDQIVTPRASPLRAGF
jgi:hypothetical protein